MIVTYVIFGEEERGGGGRIRLVTHITSDTDTLAVFFVFSGLAA